MNHHSRVACPDEAAMQRLGTQLLDLLAQAKNRQAMVITLSGDLGAGKSVLARAITHAAGYAGRVKSPTYTLIETYDIDNPVTAIKRVAHLDLYRLADPDELHYLGFDDVLDVHDIVLVEWPDKAGDLLPEATLKVSIDYCLPAGRLVMLESDSIDVDSQSSPNQRGYS